MTACYIHLLEPFVQPECASSAFKLSYLSMNSDSLKPAFVAPEDNLDADAVFERLKRDPSGSDRTFSDSIKSVGPYDIICGRSSNAFNNIGNRRFRITIRMNLNRYIKAPTRQDKGVVIASIVQLLKESGARFLKKKKTTEKSAKELVEYLELDEQRTREKVAHALRDMAVAKQEYLNRSRQRNEDNHHQFAWFSWDD